MHPVIIGTQWGDEGKGKLVDLLASNPTIKAIVRYQGGNNAGHTVVVKGEKYAFHLLPSGILYRDKVCVLGNGVIINPLVLLKELTALEKRTGGSYAKVLISSKCGLIMPWHIICDSLVAEELGTTSRGIGPAYTDLYARRGIRLADTKSKTLFIQKVEKEISWYKEYINLLLAFHKVPQEKLASLKLDAEFNVESVVSAYWNALETIKSNSLVTIGGVSEFLEQIETSGKAILFEGAQATLLDIAHGTYPYVTSSYPTTGGLYIGTGFRPKKLSVLGVVKAYTTRVGAGPFPTELTDEIGERLRSVGQEFGTTTGRPRRCGWLDLTIVNYARLINGLDELAVTKLDILSGIPQLNIAVAYEINGEKVNRFTPDLEKLHNANVIYETVGGWKEDISKVRSYTKLPKAAKSYIEKIEKVTKLPVKYIGVGPNRDQIIKR